MKYTANLNLNKPELTDYVNVSDLNENAEILDDAVGEIRKKLETQTEHFKDFSSHVIYGTAAGVNAKSIILNPAATSYTEGMGIAFKNSSVNTGAVTLNVNGLGVKKVLRSDGSELLRDALKANSIYTVRYNGTSFILQGEGGGVEVYTGTAVVGDNQIYRHPNTINMPFGNPNFTKKVELKMNRSGNFRMRFNLFSVGYNTTYDGVYIAVNDVKIGNTYTFNKAGIVGGPQEPVIRTLTLTLNQNDLVQIYARNTQASESVPGTYTYSIGEITLNVGNAVDLKVVEKII